MILLVLAHPDSSALHGNANADVLHVCSASFEPHTFSTNPPEEPAPLIEPTRRLQAEMPSRSEPLVGRKAIGPVTVV